MFKKLISNKLYNNDIILTYNIHHSVVLMYNLHYLYKCTHYIIFNYTIGIQKVLNVLLMFSVQNY